MLTILIVASIVGVLVGGAMLKWGDFRSGDTGIILIGAALILFVICIVIKSDRNEKARCAQILSMAHTSSDSIKVLTDCGRTDTNIIYMQTGR